MKLDYLNDHFLPFIALILAYYASISSYFFFASSNFSCSSNLILAASSLFRFTSSNFSLFLYFSSSVKIDFGFSFYSTGFSLFSNKSSESSSSAFFFLACSGFFAITYFWTTFAYGFIWLSLSSDDSCFCLPFG